MSPAAAAYIKRSVRELHYRTRLSNPPSMDDSEMISLVSLIPAGASPVLRRRDPLRSLDG